MKYNIVKGSNYAYNRSKTYRGCDHIYSATHIQNQQSLGFFLIGFFYTYFTIK